MHPAVEQLIINKIMVISFWFSQNPTFKYVTDFRNSVWNTLLKSILELYHYTVLFNENISTKNRNDNLNFGSLL